VGALGGVERVGLDRVVAVRRHRDLVRALHDLELAAVELAASVDVVEVRADGREVGALGEVVGVAEAAGLLVAPRAPGVAGADRARRRRPAGVVGALGVAVERGRRGDRLAAATALPRGEVARAVRGGIDEGLSGRVVAGGARRVADGGALPRAVLVALDLVPA